jgi:hypothetical protein
MVCSTIFKFAESDYNVSVARDTALELSEQLESSNAKDSSLEHVGILQSVLG